GAAATRSLFHLSWSRWWLCTPNEDVSEEGCNVTKIRRADVVAAAVCCSILVCFFLWLQHTPGGEPLFALRSQEVQKIQVGTGGHGLAQEGEREWTVEDRETIQAIVEHFNGFRYTAVGPTVVRSGA